MLYSVERIVSDISLALENKDRLGAIALARQAGEQGLDIPIKQWLNWIADPYFFMIGNWLLSDWYDALLAATPSSDAMSALQLLAILQKNISTSEELVNSVETVVSSQLGHLLMGICYCHLRKWEIALEHLDIIDINSEWWQASLYSRVVCLIRLDQWDALTALRHAQINPELEFDWVILQNAFLGVLNEYSYDLAGKFLDWKDEYFPEIQKCLPKTGVSRAFLEMLSADFEIPRILGESLRYAEELTSQISSYPSFDEIVVTPKRARVGYFWSFGGYFQDLLAMSYGDHSRYENFLYFAADSSRQSNFDESQYDHVFNFVGLSDNEVFSKINSDDLDALIVIDTIGYHSRDAVIAQRPSKRIVCYGNVFYPTFLSAIDALVLPERLIEPMAALGGHETLLSIPNGLHIAGHPAFRIFDPLPFPSGPPVIGSVASSFKMNRHWFNRVARILAAVPDARLRLDLAVAVDDEILRILELAQQAGIDQRRVDVYRAVINNGFRDRMAPLWLAIDTTAFSCYYTALQALSAGVPILTVPEALPASHLTASVLEGIGADLLICRNEQALIDKAIMLLTNPGALANLRAMVAEDVRASLFADLPASAKMWEQTLERVLALPVRP